MTKSDEMNERIALPSLRKWYAERAARAEVQRAHDAAEPLCSNCGKGPAKGRQRLCARCWPEVVS